MEAFSLKTVDHGSPAYWETVRLRERNLRLPLGLTFSREELATESDSLHLVAYYHADLLGCVTLKPVARSGQIKLRQMTVKEHWQGHGIGRVLVQYAEKTAAEQGFDQVILHARQTAMGFYEKLGYQPQGSIFTEVGIPHCLMEKKLSEQTISNPLLTPKLEL